MISCFEYRFEGETQAGMVSCEDAAKRLIDMGMVFTKVEDAVRETVDSLISKGFLSLESQIGDLATP